MSIIVATWIGALCTFGLLVGAVFTAWYARGAFRHQSEEVKILQQQAKRDIDDRRRRQAVGVFVWPALRPYDDDPDDMRAAACLRNTSERPVYDISLGWGAHGEQTWRVMLPGEERVFPGAGSAVADGTVPVWAEFRDAAGIRWRTTSDGVLDPL